MIEKVTKQLRCLIWFNIICVSIIVILGLCLYKPVKKILKARYSSNLSVEAIIKKNPPLETDEDIVKAAFTDDKHVQELYQMLKDTIEIFEAAAIIYSIDGGKPLEQYVIKDLSLGMTM